MLKRILSCLFGEGRKVGSAANSVGSTLEFAVLAAVPMPNITELVLSVFFSVHNHGFCCGSNTFSRGKTQHFHVDRHLVTGKEISSKIEYR